MVRFNNHTKHETDIKWWNKGKKRDALTKRRCKEEKKTDELDEDDL